MTKSKCKFCGSEEVVPDQYVADDYCQSCGRWQSEEAHDEDVEADYYNELIENKIENFEEKYMLKDEVVRDIITEGWDLACAYYENKEGKVKKSIIREQYPELFEEESSQKPKFNLLNYAIVKDRLGYVLAQKLSGVAEPEFAEKILDIYAGTIDTYFNHHARADEYRDDILTTLEMSIKHAIPPKKTLKRLYTKWREENND